MKGRRSCLIVAIGIALVLSDASIVRPQAQDDDCRYFSQTGYYVCDEFLVFYDARGGVGIFGYPIADAADDPLLGLRVQYFQRARMEWHPDNPDPYKVQLGLLGDELGHIQPAVQPAPVNSAISQYFPQTGHFVSYAFLSFFRQHGGVDIFGYPRSEMTYDGDYIVQYFQRAKMVWHPENVSDSQVQLANLGEMYVERRGISSGPGGPPLVTRLALSASVRYVIIAQDGLQTVFVYATDQRQEPVAGVAVSILVHYRSGDQTFTLAPTDAGGFTVHTFALRPSPPGRNVVIDVTATYGDLTGTTQTFFVPWW